MKKIGIVGTPGGWSSELLADTAKRLTGHRLLVDMKQTRLDLSAGSVWFGDQDLCRLDALIIKKIGARYSAHLLDRLEILRYCAARGLPVFSGPEKIMRVLDRLSCTVTLQLAGIPMPPTTVTESVDEAVKTVEHYGEAVFKPLYSTKARGMEIIRAGDNAREAVAEYRRHHPIMYIQKKIDIQDKDLGIVFLGGRYLTTYARCKDENAWNTTTASGGRYAAFDPDESTISLAHKAQHPFGLDFTCVDVAFTENGPVVFEVSAFGGFRGIAKARDLDAASLLVKHVLGRIGS